MKISVIIVAYKSGDILVSCLDSIEEYNDLGDELEVIVVDNSPADARVDGALLKSKYQNYRYIPADNRGFGAGNNIGAKNAKGEVLAFLNPDIILIQPVFKGIYETFVQNHKLAFLGGKLLCENLAPGFSFYFDYKPSVVKKWSLKLWNRLNRFDSEQMYIAGADMFVRKKVFEQIGMFDENIFMYYEEPDISRRIRKCFPDSEIRFCPEFKMIHLEKKSTPSSLAMIGHEMNSCIYYGKKYSLDYQKKIRFEYRYYKLKRLIYQLLRNEKSAKMNEIIGYLQQNYDEILHEY